MKFTVSSIQARLLMGVVVLVAVLIPAALCFSLSPAAEETAAAADDSPEALDVAKRYTNRACSRCMHTGAWSSCSACRTGLVPYYGVGKRTFFPVNSWNVKRSSSKRAFLPEESLGLGQGTSGFFPESNWGVYKRDGGDKRSFFPVDKWDAKRTFFPVWRYNKGWNVKRSYTPASDDWDSKRTFQSDSSWKAKREDSNDLELKLCQACCAPDSFSPRCCYFCQMK